MRVLTILAALATISCSAATTNDNAVLTTGTWGGPDVQVTVTGQGQRRNSCAPTGR